MKKGVLLLVLAMVLTMIVPTFGSTIKTISKDEIVNYESEIGTELYVKVTGKLDGTVWGSDIYTIDSDVEVAAVHAGIVKVGETKTVKIIILEGKNYYEGSTRNGVTTYEYGEWDRSFKFIDVPLPQDLNEDLSTKVFKVEDLDLRTFLGMDGTELNVIVTGTLDGTVWGNGIYTSDSHIPTAAVHAGIVKAGETKTVKITILPGQKFYEGTIKNGVESYEYSEWEGSFKFNDAHIQPSGDNHIEIFNEGVLATWADNSAIGYRLFRSTSADDIGISVTDFYITGNKYADVNVEPNTTYYYKVFPVLVEANPASGIEEKLGNQIMEFTVTIGSEVTKSEITKNFIVLQIDNPSMSVNGKEQEIDPGRGTTPVNVNGRTMVPIRAIVEAMGGTIGWEDLSQQITLTARGNTVKMWLGKKDIEVNGTIRTMDIEPFSLNGRTYVPIRFATENLNAKVDWINSTKEIIITY